MKNNANNEIILSVVIPTCNRNNTLLRAVYSVLNQNIDGLEIIVVNDAENPITHDIINIAKYNSVIFMSNPGRHGAASARNYGVSIAKGKYITFLDDDDMYLPGRLSSMLYYITNNNYSLVSSGRFIEYEDFTDIADVKNQIFGEFSIDNILFGNDIDIGFIVERQLFIELGGFDTSLTSLEDWDLILRILQKGKGYKVKRYDYIVNRNKKIVRVSDRESDGYLVLAKKWKDSFNSDWYVFMLTTSLRLNRELKLFNMIKLSLKFKTLIPLKQYIGFLIKND